MKIKNIDDYEQNNSNFRGSIQYQKGTRSRSTLETFVSGVTD